MPESTTCPNCGSENVRSPQGPSQKMWRCVTCGWLWAEQGNGSPLPSDTTAGQGGDDGA